MAELGCQARVKDWAWKMPRVREQAEKMLRHTLKEAGAHSIVIEPPEHVLVDGYVDEEGDWQPIDKPYWVMDLMAKGQTNGP